MKLINMTPHTINIFRPQDCIEQTGGRGYTLRDAFAVPALTIMPSGEVARAAQTAQNLTPVECDGLEIPVHRMAYGKPTGLPEPQEGVGLIVSALTANAAAANGRTVDDLFIVNGTVRNEDGAVIGCTGLAKV